MTLHKHLFLSYRSQEVDFALKLAADLKNFGVRLWIDRLDIKPGDDWRKSLQQGLDDCVALIAILSPAYVESDYCQRELARADRMSYPIIPILLQEISETDYPMEIERTQYLDFTDWRHYRAYQASLAKLIELLQAKYALQISRAPDAETRYLTSLIADLESRKQIFEASELDNRFTSPHLIGKDWIVESEYTLPTSDQYQLSFDSIHKIVDHCPRFILMGAMGTGKSTIMEYLVRDMAYARQANRAKTPIPLLIRLIEWKTNIPFLDFVRSKWQLKSDVVQDAAQGHVAIYLDGLDELGETLDVYLAQCQVWLASDLAPQYLVITCRTDQKAAIENLKLPQVLMRPLESQQVGDFVERYLPQTSAQLLTDINHHYLDLSGLMKNQLFLNLLIQLQQENQTLPANPGNLLKQLVAKVWQREFVRQVEQGISLPDFELGLGKFVFRVDQVPQPSGLQAFAMRTGILKQVNGKLEFVDESLQQYFAAVYFNANPHKIQQVIEQELLLLCWVAISEDSDQTLMQLAQHAPLTALKALQFTDVFSTHVLTAILSNWLQQAPMPDQMILADIENQALCKALTQLMGEGEWEIRQRAHVLILQTDCAIFDGLEETLHDLEPEMLEPTAVAIIQIGETVIPALLRMLSSDHAQLRGGAAWALGELRNRAAVPGLVTQLKDTATKVVIEVLHALRYIHDLASLPFIVELLGHRHEKVRLLVVEVLEWFGEAAVEYLIPVLEAESSEEQELSIRLIRHYHRDDVTQALLKVTYNDNSIVRAMALKALEDRLAPDVIKRIITLLSDTTQVENSEQRISDIAAALLETFQNPEAEAALKGWRVSQEKVLEGQVSNKSAKVVKNRLKFVTEPQIAVPKSASDALLNFEDKDWRVRRIAVLYLNHADLQTGLPVLSKAVHDSHVEVRITAVNVLAGFQDDVAIFELLRALNDPEPRVYNAACDALKAQGKAATIGLINALDSANIKTRQVAVEALGEIKDPEAVPALIRLLPDKSTHAMMDERLCDLAAKALLNIGTARAVRAVEYWRANLVRQQQNQAEAIERDEILLGLLERIRKESEWGDREEAAKALREYAKTLKGESIPFISQQLILALKDEDWLVRWACIEAMAWIGDKSAVLHLIKLLNDRHWMVRVAVIRALLEIGDDRAVDAVLAMLSDTNTNVREAAIEALGIFASPKAIPALDKILQDEDPLLRLAAVEALGRIDSPNTVYSLVQALEDVDKHVRWAATYNLSDQGHEFATQSLIACLADNEGPYWEDMKICDLAAKGLDQIGTPIAQQAVSQWRKSKAKK